jgi:general nucleoside transport system permease protein
MPGFLSLALVIDFLAATVRMATPLGYAAVGGVFSERSGVFNIALEGMMLAGAFAAVMGSHWAGDPWAGLALAAAAGAALGAVHAAAAVSFGANQIVVGLAINLMALGATTYLNRVLIRAQEILRVPAFEPVALPGLSQLPVLGPALFRQPLPVYLLAGLIGVAAYVLFKTPAGLAVRAVGEYPRAVDTAGLPVAGIRYACVIVSGAMAGLGGAFLSVAHVNMFTENMSAGRGFIALAAIIFGKWHPVGAMAACLLFGAADAFQLRVQAYALGIPYQIPVMMPYLLALLVMSGLVGRSPAPAAAGIPYRKEES